MSYGSQNKRSLLALILLSYMVVPIRDMGNKFFSTSAITTTYSSMTLPTLAAMDINDFNVGNCDNYDNVRGCMISPSKPSTRIVFMSSS